MTRIRWSLALSLVSFALGCPSSHGTDPLPDCACPGPDSGLDAGADAGPPPSDAGGICADQDARGVGNCLLLLGVAWQGGECVTIGGCECVGADCDALYDSPEACRASHGSCTVECAPQDARAQGPCAAELGVVWDGSSCRSISGCSCVGADCGELASSLESCLAAHAACTRHCGGFLGGTCLDDELCDYPEGAFCGAADESGVCVPRPTDCPEPGGVPVCGCDGNDYLTECSARLAGTDVAGFGSCDGEPLRFGVASPGCGPADGAAWDLRLTAEASACGLADAPSLTFTIWRDLTAEGSGSYRIGARSELDGEGRLCSAPGACQPVVGVVAIHVFAAGEVTRFDYRVTTADGVVLEDSNVEVTSFCPFEGPCG